MIKEEKQKILKYLGTRFRDTISSSAELNNFIYIFNLQFCKRKLQKLGLFTGRDFASLHQNIDKDESFRDLNIWQKRKLKTWSQIVSTFNQ